MTITIFPNEPSLKTKEKIVQAALELFAHRGYGSTSVKLIARAAGVSQGLMYNYFSSKDQLLEEICRRGYEDIRSSWSEEQGATPLLALEALLNTSFALIREHSDFWRLYYSLRNQPELTQHLATLVEEMRAAVMARLVDYCRTLGHEDSETEAYLLLALIDGVGQQLVLDADYPISAVTTAIIAKYKAKGEM